MAKKTPPLFVRVSTPAGHFTVPAATAERAGSDWSVLKSDALDKQGRPIAPKRRVDIESTPKAAKKAAAKRTQKPRGGTAAATPTPDPETVSGDDTKE